MPSSLRPIVFRDYSAELIAEWCGVSVQTASQWKSGIKKPSRQALRLFGLYREGRVLGTEWRGWRVNKGSIVDPDGNSTTAAQLYGYCLILQWVAAVAAKDPKTQEQYYQLLKQA